MFMKIRQSLAGVPEHKNVFRLLPRLTVTGGKEDEDNRLLWGFQHLRL